MTDPFEQLLRQLAGSPQVSLSDVQHHAARQQTRLEAGDTLAQGRFLLKSRLGEGGMGVVFVAEDRQEGREVALKTLASAESDHFRLESLRREGRALSRLEHPGVVEVFGSGVDGVRPWYAMELLTGHTMNGPASGVKERLGWVAQVCHALAYIHGEGLVHCDLKPDNVLIEAGGRAVVLDFGLAVWFETRLKPDRLAQASRITGTPAYLCPERIAGLEFDARADLYALGCMLYEVLTGRLPFESDTITGLFDKHTHTDPQPPSQRVEGLPAALDEVVLALLSKRPGDRPGHAARVLSALEEAGVETSEHPEAPQPRPCLYPAPFTGQGGHLGVLRSRSEEARGSGGDAVVLEGESGAGKTRLALQLIQSMGKGAGRILIGHGVSLDAGGGAASGDPLSVFEAMIGHLVDDCHHSGQVTRQILGPRGPVLAPFDARIKALPGQGALPAPSPLPPNQARERLIEALMGALESWCEAQPVLCILDDLQWADPLSMAAALRLLGEPPGGWFVLGLVRSEAVPEALAAAVPTRRRLRGLSQVDVRAVIDGVLGYAPAPDELIEAVSSACDGNPFFISEYLTTAVEVGALHMTSRGHWALSGSVEALPTSSSILALLDRRLASLDEEATRLCQVASVLGRQSPMSRLSAFIAGDLLDDALAQMVRRAILKEIEGESVRFTHDKLREAVYTRMSPERRLALHRKAAEVIGTEASVGQKVDSAGLGWHLERSEQPQRAWLAYMRAGQDAIERNAYGSAETHLRAALRVAHTAERRLRAASVLSEEVYKLQGRVEEAIGLLEGALDEEGLPADGKAAAMAVLGALVLQVDGAQAAEVIYEAVLALCDAHGLVETQCVAFNDLGVVHWKMGDLDKARAFFEKALPLRRAHGDARGEGKTLQNLCALAVVRGEHEEALSLGEQAVVCNRRAGDKLTEGVSLCTLGNTLLRRGDEDAALGRYGEALALFVELGAKGYEALIRANMGLIYEGQGLLDESQESYEWALAATVEVKDRVGEAFNLRGLASVKWRRGQHVEAMALCRESLAVSDKVGNCSEKVSTLVLQGDLHSALGAPEAARSALEESLAMSDEQGDHTMAARALIRLGVLEETLEAFGEALEYYNRAQQHAERVDHQPRLAASRLGQGRCFVSLGRLEDARAALEQVRSLRPMLPPGTRRELDPEIQALGVLLEGV